MPAPSIAMPDCPRQPCDLEREESDELRALMNDSLIAAEALVHHEAAEREISSNNKDLQSRNARPVYTNLPLPLELRTCIYKFVICDTPISCPTDRNLRPTALRYRPGSPFFGLFRVSRQIRAESLSTFYDLHALRFVTTDDLYRHLQQLTLSRMQCIKHVRVICRGSKANEAFVLLRECSGLRSLSLYLLYGIIPAREALYRIRGIDDLRIQILPTGDSDDAQLTKFSPVFLKDIDDIRDAIMQPRAT